MDEFHESDYNLNISFDLNDSDPIKITDGCNLNISNKKFETNVDDLNISFDLSDSDSVNCTFENLNISFTSNDSFDENSHIAAALETKGIFNG